MATKNRKPATKKELTIIARYTLKRNGHVCYSYRPSKKDEQPYCTTVIAGHATGCTCPARTTFKKRVPCKHMTHAESLEQARQIAQSSAFDAYDVHEAVDEIVASVEIGDAYEIAANTKNVQQAVYGSCGHLVKPGQEGDLCGGCYQRLYA
jgi:hypothetical protein